MNSFAGSSDAVEYLIKPTRADDESVDDESFSKCREVIAILDNIKKLKGKLGTNIATNIDKINENILDLYKDELYDKKDKFLEFNPVVWFTDQSMSSGEGDDTANYVKIDGRIIEFNVFNENDFNEFEEDIKEAYVDGVLKKYKTKNMWIQKAKAKGENSDPLYYGKYMKMTSDDFVTVHVLINGVNIKSLESKTLKKNSLFYKWGQEVFPDDTVDDEYLDIFYKSMAFHHDYNIKGWKLILNIMERNVMVKETLKSHCNKRYKVQKAKMEKGDLWPDEWENCQPWCYACGLPLLFSMPRQIKIFGSDCDHLLSLLPTVLLHSMQEEEDSNLYLPMHAWCNQALKSEKLMNMNNEINLDDGIGGPYCPFIKFNDDRQIRTFCEKTKLNYGYINKALNKQQQQGCISVDNLGVATLYSRKSLYSNSVINGILKTEGLNDENWVQKIYEKLEHFTLNAMAATAITKMSMDPDKAPAMLNIVIDLHKQMKTVEVVTIHLKNIHLKKNKKVNNAYLTNAYLTNVLSSAFSKYIVTDEKEDHHYHLTPIQYIIAMFSFDDITVQGINDNNTIDKRMKLIGVVIDFLIDRDFFNGWSKFSFKNKNNDTENINPSDENLNLNKWHAFVRSKVGEEKNKSRTTELNKQFIMDVYDSIYNSLSEIETSTARDPISVIEDDDVEYAINASNVIFNQKIPCPPLPESNQAGQAGGGNKKVQKGGGYSTEQKLIYVQYLLFTVLISPGIYKNEINELSEAVEKYMKTKDVLEKENVNPMDTSKDKVVSRPFTPPRVIEYANQTIEPKDSGEKIKSVWYDDQNLDRERLLEHPKMNNYKEINNDMVIKDLDGIYNVYPTQMRYGKKSRSTNPKRDGKRKLDKMKTMNTAKQGPSKVQRALGVINMGKKE